MKLFHSFFVAGLVIALGSSLIQGGDTAPAVAPPTAMGYYPSYRASLPPQTIGFEHFTHVIHAFATADANGKLSTPGNIPSSELTAAAHAKNVKVLLGLGGGANGGGFGKMARNAEQRRQFVQDVAQLITDKGYDGAVIDWEFPEASDREVVVALTTELRAALRASKADSLLMMAVPAKRSTSKGYDGARLKELVDYIHVMTYDYHGRWNHAGHNSPLHPTSSDTIDGKDWSFASAVEYWNGVQGFRREQIIVGFAAYGRGFKATEWGVKPTEASQFPEITYKQASELIGKGWARQWDAEARVPWLLKDDGTERISYDDSESIAEKVRWVKQNGLPGFFFWEISQDIVEGEHVLAAAAQEAWRSQQ